MRLRSKMKLARMRAAMPEARIARNQYRYRASSGRPEATAPAGFARGEISRDGDDITDPVVLFEDRTQSVQQASRQALSSPEGPKQDGRELKRLSCARFYNSGRHV